MSSTGEVTNIEVPCAQFTVPRDIDNEGNVVGLIQDPNDVIYGFVLTPTLVSDSLEDLVNFIQTLDLQQGISNSLESKIHNVRDSLTAANAANRNDARHKLEAFVNAVNAQKGKKLTEVQADRLLSWAMEILALL
jgi:hypothetical protein